MTNWTNHDKTAFNEWCNSDLGQKFLAHLRESRPKFDGSMDLNSMAMMGAIYKGYEQALEQIDKMRLLSTAKGIQPRPYVSDTHKD